MTTSRLAGAQVPASTTRRPRRTQATTGLSAHDYAQAKRMSEEDLKNNTIKLGRALRVLVAHFRPSLVTRKGRLVYETPIDGDGKGYPDLTIVGPGGVKFRELKSWTGKLSPEQQVWIAALEEAGADVGVWDPQHWFDGTIRRELESIARRGAA